MPNRFGKGCLCLLCAAMLFIRGTPDAALADMPDIIIVDGIAYHAGDEVVGLRDRTKTVTYIGDGQYRAEISSAQQYTLTSDGWVNYKLEDYGTYYQLQHPWSSVKFYDYYTEVWDESFTEIRIYDDRWDVEYLNKKGNWISANLYNVTRSYEVVDGGIKLYRTGDSDIGQRVEEYYFPNGGACKITIYQTCDSAHTIRYVWQPSGIVAATEHPLVIPYISDNTTEPYQGKTSGLNYYDTDGVRVYSLRWYDALGIADDISYTVDTSAQGRKATIAFGEFDVAAGNTAVLDPDSFYPDADAETSSVDGYVQNYVPAGSPDWATIHDATDGTEVYDSNSDAYPAYLHMSGGKWIIITRGIFLFDTDSLPDGATITSANLSLWGVSIAATNSLTRVNVFSSNPASDTALSTADYDVLGTTAFSTEKSPAGIVINAYNVWELNASGLAAINKTGITKFGVRESHYDAPNVAPPSGLGINIQFRVGTAEDAAHKPTLTVVYSAGSTPTVNTETPATSITDEGATVSGNVSDIGSANVTERGFEWGISSGNYTDNWTEVGNWGTADNFSHAITGLDAGTLYYYRAMAYNADGWAYGSEDTFLTLCDPPTNVSATDGDHSDKVVVTWTKSFGATGYNILRDGGIIDTVGDVATYDDNTATAGNISSAGTATASDGSSGLHVTLSLAGEGTNNGTTYSYKLQALNATGNSTDSAADNGYRSVGTLSYQWQVDSGGGFGNIAGGTTDPYDYTGADNPTVTAGNATASDNTTGFVTLTATGTASADGATWDYQCVVSSSYATNSPQTSTSDTGYKGASAVTYEWYRSWGDADSDFSGMAGEGGTTNPYNDVNGAMVPSGRYYYAMVSMSGATSDNTTHDRGYMSSTGGGGITTKWWPIPLVVPFIPAIKKQISKLRGQL